MGCRDSSNKHEPSISIRSRHSLVRPIESGGLGWCYFGELAPGELRADRFVPIAG
jgi:hypothetical protein